MTAKNKEIEAKAKAKAKAKPKPKPKESWWSEWGEPILGCAIMIGAAIGVILLILYLLGVFGGEDEVVADDGVPESIVNVEQRDWYKSKLEENGGTYHSDCWFWDYWGTFFEVECGYLWTNAYYHGKWKDNVLHGWGKEEWFDGNKYEGNFKDGDYHGYGVLEFKSGGKYKGNFKDGDYHGYGVLERSDGSKIEGYWKNDQLHGWVSYEDEEGVINKGHYKNNRRHGRFEITAPNEEMEVVYYSDGEKVDEICEEIGFPKDSSKHEECIFGLVTETLSFEY